MPIYEYRCQVCGQISEIFQGMGDKDDPLNCKYCGSREIERILSPASFTFKEGGFSASSQRCCEEGVSCANPKRCCERR